MKKLAILAAFAVGVGFASAASITWGYGGTMYITDSLTGTAVRADSYTGDMPWSLALVYVGQNQDSFSIDSLTANSVVDTLAYDVATSGKNAGKWNPTTKITSTTEYANNASFAVVLYHAASTSFDYIYSGTTTAGSAVTSAVTVSDMSAQGRATVYGTGSGSASGVSVAVVPEPSVALMGLLGIGMLLKRRRA